MLGLVRRNPDLGLSAFDEFDKIFDNMWRSFGADTTSMTLPSTDIYSEDDKSMVVELHVPGYDHKDIGIDVKGNVLEISGERSIKEEKDRKRSYMLHESTVSFARKVVLPEGADFENISATLDKGVLKVTIPVAQPQSRRIEIATPKNKSAKKLAANTAKE